MTPIKELPKRQNLPIFVYLSEKKKQTTFTTQEVIKDENVFAVRPTL